MNVKKVTPALLLATTLFINLLGCSQASVTENESSNSSQIISTEPPPSVEEDGGESVWSSEPQVSTTVSQKDETNNTASAASTVTQTMTHTGAIGEFRMQAPSAGELATSLKPTFTWEKAENADSYTLVVEEMRTDGSYQKRLEKKGIQGNSYTPPSSMKANTIYRWSVTAVNKTNKKNACAEFDESEKVTFMTVDYKTHEANTGLNFTFKNKVSEEVLRNYLSRSMIATVNGSDIGKFRENLRMILYTGAKYIARAEVSWLPGINEYSMHEYVKENLAYAHAIDPELVFEACIFETTSRSVEQIPIPDWVFKAFGQPVENRNFSYDKMIFTDGLFADRWGKEASVPDMTRLETQMFFYYRACTYIDLGFEGLHMGQVSLIGAHDSGWKCWQKVMNMIREYAKTHARRGFVFLNAHTHGMVGPDGNLLFDFHAMPYRGVEPDGSVAHPPTEDNPQKVELKVGHLTAIYKKSLGGKTYSGWSCDSLPYFVELDNWSGYDKATMDQPIQDSINLWGGDEITWFANQPQWYRQQWLQYAYEWVQKTDPAGYAQMPGNRTAALRTASGYQQLTYYCNNSQFHKDGFNDEACIRQIWVNDRKSK